MRITRRDALASGMALLCSTLAAAPQSEEARLAAFFDRCFEESIADDPLAQSALGRKTGMDRWPGPAIEHVRRQAAQARRHLAELDRFDLTKLSAQAQLSCKVFRYAATETLLAQRWRKNFYPVCQMRRPQRIIPQTLINNHPITDRGDAEAYIARVRGVKPYLAHIVEELEQQAAAGVRPPQFSYPLVIDNCEKLIRGAPFDSDAPSPILADFTTKLNAITLPPNNRQHLDASLRRALVQAFGPGVRRLIEWLKHSATLMSRNDGVWAMPDGDAYYRARLEMETTLPLDPNEVHREGIAEVERIHSEMERVIRSTGFSRSLTDFFAFVRTDARFYYPDTSEGREAYLNAMRAKISAVEARLGEILTRAPSGRMIVKPVEPWLEKSAGTAGYFAGAPDGSRPGILYVNTRSMRNLPIYELSALAYHEGIPGHHLENAISAELTELPLFRRHGEYTAYSEGWALYAERLPYAMGLYGDPYQQFGQLSLELMRAGRLVVDTGVHHLRWTREQAVAWLDTHTAASHEDNVTSIQRYIVTPAQAVAYETGKLKMMDLRARAQKALGATYDLRSFNDVLLGNGPLPLTLLDQQIDSWIAERVHA